MTQAQEFWQYSVAIYADTAVTKACLLWQDQFDADVNIILACAWLGSRSQLISEQQLKALCASTAEIQRHGVQPLRSVRRFAKSRLSDQLYQQLKQVELAVEQHQQGQIEDFIGSLQFSLAVDSCAALRENLGVYGTILGVSQQDIAQLISVF